MPGEQEQTVAGEEAAETTADQQAQTVDESSKEEGKSEEATKSPLESLDIKDVVTKDDGTLEWTIEDEETGQKSTFTGKTMGELLSNVSKRLKESNVMARRLKATDIRGVRPKAGAPEDEAAPDLATTDHVIEPPDQDKIREDIFKKAGIDPRIASWTDAQWRAYAEEKDMRDFQVTKIQRAIEQLNNQVEKVYSDQSRDFLNETYLNHATENVEEMLAESGLEESKFTGLYHEVLNRVWADKRNFDNGTLIPGRVEAAMHKAIRAAELAKEKPKIQEEAARKILEGQRRKESIKTGGASAKDFKPQQKEPAKSYLEATTRALADLRAGKYDKK